MTYEPLFPLDYFASRISQVYPDACRSGLAVLWRGETGQARLAVERKQYRTADNFVVSEIVTLRHEIAGWQPHHEFVAASNRWATTMALVEDRDGFALVSRVAVFEDDKEGADLMYGALMYAGAASADWHAVHLMRGQFRVPTAEARFSQAEIPPPYSEGDFEELRRLSKSRGCFSSGSGPYFVVEFPWDAGALTNLIANADPDRLQRLNIEEEERDRLAGRTSLFQVLQAEHPMYGKGIQATLEIPTIEESRPLHEVAKELNEWEATGLDLAPLFGSWCVGPRAVSFVTFVPTFVCFPGLLRNLLSWAIARHFAVKGWLQSSSGPIN